jgi:hypothetical protein
MIGTQDDSVEERRIFVRENSGLDTRQCFSITDRLGLERDRLPQ